MKCTCLNPCSLAPIHTFSYSQLPLSTTLNSDFLLSHFAISKAPFPMFRVVVFFAFPLFCSVFFPQYCISKLFFAAVLFFSFLHYFKSVRLFCFFLVSPLQSLRVKLCSVFSSFFSRFLKTLSLFFTFVLPY